MRVYAQLSFGKHKGLTLDAVPCAYLEWLYRQPWLEKSPKRRKLWLDVRACLVAVHHSESIKMRPRKHKHWVVPPMRELRVCPHCGPKLRRFYDKVCCSCGQPSLNPEAARLQATRNWHHLRGV